MLSTIVDGDNSDGRTQFVHSLLSPSLELIHLTAESTSISLKQIHSLLADLAITARLPRLVWIEDCHLLTVPASNALLKVLEEPPTNTQFYLTCDAADGLLPTIRSRCTLHSLTGHAESPLTPLLPVIKSAMAATPGDRLGLAAVVPSDRPLALAWFTGLLEEIHTTLGRTSARSGRLLLSQLGRLSTLAHTRLRANVGVSLAAGNFFLHLPKSK